MTTILAKKPVLRTILLLIALTLTISLAFIFRPVSPLDSLVKIAQKHRPDTDSLTTTLISASTGSKQADTVYSTATNLTDALAKTREKLIENPDYEDYKYFRLDIAYGAAAANPTKLINNLPTTLTDHTYYATTDAPRARKLTMPSSLTKSQISDMLRQNARFLATQVEDDGSFIYGFNILTTKPLSTYSMNAHAAAISALLRAYKITKDSSLVSQAAKAIEYLVDFTVISEQHPDRAFVENASAEAIDLGATALAAVALADYQDIAGNSDYSELLGFLANGIQSMSATDTACFMYTHELELDLTSKDTFISSYYDVQATYALLRAAGTLNKLEYLTSATKNLDRLTVSETHTTEAAYWLIKAIDAYNAVAEGNVNTYELPEYSPRTPEEIYATFTEPWVAMFSYSPSSVIYSFTNSAQETSLPINQGTIFELVDYLQSKSE